MYEHSWIHNTQLNSNQIQLLTTYYVTRKIPVSKYFVLQPLSCVKQILEVCPYTTLKVYTAVLTLFVQHVDELQTDVLPKIHIKHIK